MFVMERFMSFIYILSIKKRIFLTSALILISCLFTQAAITGFTSVPPTRVEVNSNYSYHVTLDKSNVVGTLSYKIYNKPSWLTLKVNEGRDAIITGTPPESAYGDYTFYLYAKDDESYVYQTIRIEVDNLYRNATPEIKTTANNQCVVNHRYTYYFKATDGDLRDNLQFKVYNKPSWLTLKDNGDRTGLLSGTPPENAYGDYTFYLYVSDGKSFDYQTIRIEVDNAYQNASPIFETNTNTNTKVNVNEAYNYYFKTFDEDLCDNIQFKVYNKPSWLTLKDNGDRTGLLSGTPPTNAYGDYTFYLYAFDGKSYTYQTIRIEVDNPYRNTTPVFETNPNLDTKVNVNEQYAYYFKAFDEDLCDNIQFKVYNKPSWLTLKDNGDRTGLLSGTPPESAYGDYTFYLYASDGKSYAYQTIRIEVDNPYRNSSPIIKTEARTQAYTHEMYTYHIKASDADLCDNTTFKVYNKPSWLTFKDNGDGTGLLKGVPTMSHYGDYTLYIYATDGESYAYQTIRLEVLPNPLMPDGTADAGVNYKPTFVNQYLPQARINRPYKAVVFAHDLESNAATILNSANDLPQGLELKSTQNENGLLVATIEGTLTTAANYTFTLDITDGTNTTTKQYTIEAVQSNNKPQFQSEGSKILFKGSNYVYNIFVNDADEDDLTISYIGDLPDGLTFSQTANCTATLSGTISSARQYTVRLSVKDGENEIPVYQDITIDIIGYSHTVNFTNYVPLNNGDNSPTISSNGDGIVLKNGSYYPYSYNLFFNDADEEDLTISYTGTLPAGLELTQNGNCGATLSGNLQEAGEHTVNIEVKDVNNNVTPQTITIQAVGDDYNVNYSNYEPLDNGDNSPSISSNGDGIVLKNGSFYPYSYNLFFNDADEEDLTISYTGTLPAGLELTQNGNCGATLSGNLQKSGEHKVYIEVKDIANSITQHTVVIHAIGDDYDTDYTNEDPTTENHSPVFLTQGHATIFVNELYSYKIIANDEDGDNVDFIYDNIQLGGALGLVESSTEKAIATLSGTINTPGVHTIQVGITDGEATVYQDITITVLSDSNLPVFETTPTVTSIEAKSTYSYTITVSDVDADDILTVSAVGDLPGTLEIPPHATTVDATTGKAKATVVMSGTIEEPGSYPIILKVNDGTNDSEPQTFTLTVTEVNVLPNFTSSQEDVTITKGENFAYNVFASDANASDLVTITKVDPTPSNLNITEHSQGSDSESGNATANAILTGSFTSAGECTVKLKVSDDKGAENFQTFNITVAEPNALPVFETTPTVTSIEAKSTYSYTITVSDVDADDILTVSAVGDLPGTLEIPPHATIVDATTGKAKATVVMSGTIEEPGSYPINLKVNDGTNDSEPQVFTLTVTEVNVLPTFTSSQEDVTITKGETFAYNVFVSDANASDLVTITKVDPTPSNLYITEHNQGIDSETGNATANAILTGSFTSAGKYTVKLKVTDDKGAENFQTFNITVAEPNALPVFETTPTVTSIEAKSTYSYTITVSDVDADDILTVSAVGDLPGTLEIPPHATTVDATTGKAKATVVMSGTIEEPGRYPINLKVNDGTNDSEPQKFTLVVTEAINTAPIFTGKNTLTATTSKNNSFRISASDSDIEELTITLVEGSVLPDGIVLSDHTYNDGNGKAANTLSGIIETAGTYNFQLQVSDGEENVTEDYRIIVEEENSIPYFTCASVFSMLPGENISFDITAKDEDGNDLTISTIEGENLPSGFTLNNSTSNDGFGNATAKISVSGISEVGCHYFTLQVSDGVNVIYHRFTLVVTEKRNNAPNFIGSRTINVSTGESLSLTFEALDEDNDNITISLAYGILPPGVYMSNWIGLEGTNKYDMYGSIGKKGVYTIYLRVSDGKDESIEPFIINVNNTGAIPKFIGGNEFKTYKGINNSIRISVEGDYAEELMVSLSEGLLPPGMELSGIVPNKLYGGSEVYLNGVITEIGTYSFSLKAKDASNQETTCNYKIDVNESNHEVLIEDLEGLMALYNATDGANWNNSDNWGTEESIDSWSNLYFNKTSKKIERLFLKNNNLNGYIPSAIGLLSDLQYLYLDLNSLVGEIPVTIGNLKKLIYLELTGNDLAGSIPIEFGNLTKLVYFKAFNNHLSGSIPIELGNLTELQELRLGFNQLGGSIPSELSLMSSLRFLDLENNDITGSIPEALGNLNSLTRLSCHSNSLCGSIPQEIGDLNKLKYLQLSNNNLREDIPITLGNLSALESVGLGNNNLMGSIPESLGTINTLDYFRVDCNKLSGTIPASFINYFSFFLINNNYITGKLPEVFDGNSINIHTNNFTFEHLIGSKSVLLELGKSRAYAPQRLFGKPTTVEVTEGVEFIYDIDIDENINGSTYSWYKQGDSPGSGTPVFEYTTQDIEGADENVKDINNDLKQKITEDQAGTYVVYVTNEEFKDADGNALLTLQSEPITINVTKPEDCTPEDQRQALIEFYNSTGGDKWNNNTNWCSDTEPVENWHGITIDEECNVIKLHLRSNNLSGIIPESFGNLKFLQEVLFYNNNLTGEIPQSIGNLKALRALEFSRNNMSGEIPPTIGELSSLVWLYLWGNQLNGKIPPQIAKLSNLETLYISSNSFSDKIPDLTGLVSAQKIYLHRNDLTGPIPESLFSMSHLTNIAVSDNMLSGKIPDFSKLTNISSLSLGINEFTDWNPESLEGLNKLSTFKVQDNDLSGDIPDIFNNLPSLTAIVLDNNNFTGEIPQSLLKKENLSTLTINSNKFSDVIVSDLDVSKVTKYNIEDNNLTFRHLIPHYNNFNQLGSNFTYSPQKTFGQPNTVEAIEGVEFIYDIDIDENINGSTYSWYKIGDSGEETLAFEYTTQDIEGADPNVNDINNDLKQKLTADQAGTYVVYVTNDELMKDSQPLLTLQSEPITINVTKPTDCVPQSERDALMALYNATNGSKWTHDVNKNWGTSAPIAEWEGIQTVKVDDVCHVITITLPNRGLKGELPDIWADLPHLRRLYLYSNDLTGSIPPSLTLLKESQIIALHNNDFREEIPEGFGSMPKLTQLTLSGNQLTGSIPPDLLNSSSLKEVTLKYNNLNAIPTQVGDMSNLVTFDASYNQIAGDIPSGFGKLDNLEYLNLKDNEFSGPIPTDLADSRSLKTIEFTSNNIEGAIPDNIGDISSLVILNLTSNELTGSIPPSIGTMPNLSSLNVSSNKLDGTLPEFDGTKMINIKVINLSHNSMVDKIPESMGSLTSLSSLYLRDNNFEGGIPKTFGNLTNLKRLYLYDNNLTGNIDPSLGALTNVEYFYAHNNELSGTIPVGVFSNYNYIHIPNNNFTFESFAPHGEVIRNNSGNTLVYKPQKLFGERETVEAIKGQPFVYNIDIDEEVIGSTYSWYLQDGKGEKGTLVFQYKTDGTKNNDLEITSVTADLTGTYIVYVTNEELMKDGQPLLTLQSEPITINVINNTPPVFESIPPEYAFIGKRYRYNIVVSDADGDVLEVTVANKPEWLNLYNNGNYYLQGTPADELVDQDFDVELEVYDGKQSTKQTFVVSVKDELNCVPETEISALEKLFNATNGPGWRSEDPTWSSFKEEKRWKRTNPVNHWHGVYVDSCHVRSISLGSNLLDGELPDIWDELPYLRVIKMERNGLKGKLPESIGRLKKLVVFVVKSNDIEGVIPEGFGSMKKLRDFNIMHNNFIGPLPADMGDSESLVNIYMYNNNIDGEIPPNLATIETLQNLYLGQNDLTGEIPTGFESLPALITLRLFNNQLTGKIPGSLGNSKSLQVVYLHGNGLTGEIPDNLGNIPTLTNLALSSNKLTGNVPPSLGKMQSLVSMNLSKNLLDGLLPEVDGTVMNKVTSLNFSENSFTGPVPESYGTLSSLVTLNLFNNKLSGDLHPTLGTMPNIVNLNLNNNNLDGTIPSGTLEYSRTQIRINRYTFEDLLPHASILSGQEWGDYPWYKWQKTFGEAKTYEVTPGEPFVHPVDIDEGVVGNKYEWYRSNTRPGRHEPVFSYTTTEDNLNNDLIHTFYEGEGGTYYCHVTNDKIEGFHLKSEPITVTVNPYCVAESEINALKELFDATNGPGWLYEDKDWSGYKEERRWKDSNPVNNWYGVGVRNCHVRVLNLTNKNLVGELPDIWSRLPKLEVIYLNNNKNLTGELYESFAKLDSLKILKIERNDLSGTIPEGFGSKEKLRELNLASNQFTGFIPADLGNSNSLINIYFNNNNLDGEMPPNMATINTLEKLHLQGNSISGSIPTGFGSLSSLTQLYLHHNQLTNEIPGDLGNSRSLVTLYLHYNGLTGEIPSDLGNSKSLVTLYLHYNKLTGKIPGNLGNIPTLKSLVLSNNKLTGNIPPSLGKMPSLEGLNLSDNDLTGELPDIDPLIMTKIRGIRITDNNITGTIPDSWGNALSLTHLSLKNNQLSGDLYTSIGELPNIVEFNVENNNLDGNIPTGLMEHQKRAIVRNNKYTYEDLLPYASILSGQEWGDYPVYKWQKTFGEAKTYEVTPGEPFVHPVDIDEGVVGNKYEWYKGNTSPDRHEPVFSYTTTEDNLNNDLIHTFYEGEGGTYYCHVTNDKIEGFRLKSEPITITINPYCVPQSEINALKELFNATNNGQGWLSEDPTWSGYKEERRWNDSNPVNDWYGVYVKDCHVRRIVLPNQRLEGELPDIWDKLPYLQKVYLNENKLTGELHESFGRLNDLVDLKIYINQLKGSIPEGFGSMESLSNLSLMLNDFTGPIPTDIGNSSSLVQLQLYGNNLDGEIPPNLATIKTLENLHLQGNNLTGPVPTGFGSLSSLKQLRLNNNQLTDEIPGDLGNSKSLEILYLQRNGLTGEIPENLFNIPTLITLAISYNELTGSVPSKIGEITSLKELYLHYNDLTGSLPKSIGGLTQLTHLYVNNNLLEGPLPEGLGGLSQLTNCYLHDNNFTGDIPSSVGDLPNLKVFYAYRNNLNGSLPRKLLTEPKYTHLTYNQLTFEDLLPHADYLNSVEGAYPAYSPQNNFEVNSTVYATVGESFKFELDIDEGIENNVYEWYIKGRIPGVHEPEFRYTYSDNNTNDLETVYERAGTYNYKIYVTNSGLPKLTLISKPITIIVQSPCSVPQEQVDALMSFYENAGGEDWKSENDGDDTNNWDPVNNPDVRTWHGVRLDEDCNVIGLDLCDNNLVGKISENLCSLKYLKWLRLCNNTLYGAVPVCKELGELEEIDVNDNPIIYVPDDICELPKLKVLKLQNNWLSFRTIISLLSKCSKIEIGGQDLPEGDDCGYLKAIKGRDFIVRLGLKDPHPQNAYTWYHNDDVVDLSNPKYQVVDGNLYVNNITSEDEGSYYCEITNSSASGITITSCTIDINVTTLEELCTVPEDQLQALQGLFVALDGPNWKSENDNDPTNDWDIVRNPDVSRWHGVQLDEDCNVIKLDLSNNNLTGELPDDICVFKKIRIFHIFKNFISGSIPECVIVSWYDIEDVDIGDNYIYGYIPDICKFKKLRRFRLSGNRYNFWDIINFRNKCKSDVVDFGIQYDEDGAYCGKHKALQGQDFELKLGLDNPHPDNIYRWYHKGYKTPITQVEPDGVNYEAKGSDLTILNVDESKGGIYFCVIANPNVEGVTIEKCKIKIKTYSTCEALNLDDNSRFVSLDNPVELIVAVPENDEFKWQYTEVPELDEGVTNFKVYVRVAPGMENELGLQVPDWAAGNQEWVEGANVSKGASTSHPMVSLLEVGKQKEKWYWQVGLVYELDEYGQEVIDWSGTGQFYTEPAQPTMSAMEYLKSGTHTNKINWVYSETYLDDGITTQGIVYMDGLGRTRQVQGLNNTEGKILTAETVYSEEGGGTVQTLPAPKLDKQFGYAENFFEVKEESGAIYDFSTEHFDREILVNEATGLTALIDAPKVSTEKGTVGHYYSNQSIEDFVDNANGYPYVYNVSSKSPINRVYLSTNGAGDVFRMKNGEGKENKHFYGKPTRAELVHAFGTKYVDGIDLASISKTTTYDADGVGYITYKDNEGKVIATAMTDAYLEGLQELDERGMEKYTVHIDPLEAGMFEGNLLGETAVSRFDIPYGDVPVKFHYTMDLNSFRNSTTGDLCLKCEYDVFVKVINNATGVVEYELTKTLTPSEAVCNGSSEEVVIIDNFEKTLKGPAGFTVERTVMPKKDGEQGFDILQEASDNLEHRLRVNEEAIRTKFEEEYFKHEAYYVLRDNYTEEDHQDWTPDIDCYEAFSLYGSGNNCYSSGMMDEASFNTPKAIAVDMYGNQYVADAGNHVIRIIEGLGQVGLFAGEPGVSGTDGRFKHPADIVYSDAPYYGAGGALFVADRDNNRVCKLNLNGNIIQVFNTGDNSKPVGLCTDAKGNIYVATQGNNGLYLISNKGNINPLTHVSAAPLVSISDVAVDRYGTIFISDNSGNAIYYKTATGGWEQLLKDNDGINTPVSIGVDRFNHLFISNSGNHHILRVNYEYNSSNGKVEISKSDNEDEDPSIKVISGSIDGNAGDVDDTEENIGVANFNNPAGITVSNDGDIMLADAGNNKIKRLITTICPNQKDPCITGDCEDDILEYGYADEVRFSSYNNSLHLSDLDGYYKRGRRTYREEYPIMGIEKGDKISPSSKVYKDFVAAYDRNYMVELSEENLEIYTYNLIPASGSDITESHMPLLRDNEPLNKTELGKYKLLKVVIDGDCMLSCEIEEEDNTEDCKDICKRQRYEIKHQMLEIRKEIRKSGYKFKYGKWKFPFYRLIDRLYPFNEEVYNYLSDDRASELYDEYSTLKERYAHFDYDMCFRGCTNPENAKSTPCESCNSVFMDNANEKADSLLNGVQHLISEWELSLEEGNGFPYTAIDLCETEGDSNELDDKGRLLDENGKIVFKEERLAEMGYSLVEFLFEKLEKGETMDMSQWKNQGDTNNECSNCSPQTTECDAVMTYDVSQFPTIVIPAFNKSLVEAQEAFDRCMALNSEGYAQTLWDEQKQNCLTAIGPEPGADADEGEWEAWKEQEAHCNNLQKLMIDNGNAIEKPDGTLLLLPDYAEREIRVMQTMEIVYPDDSQHEERINRCREIIVETCDMHLGDLERYLMDMEMEQSCLNNCQMDYERAYRQYITDSIRTIKREIRNDYTTRCYGNMNENFDISYKQSTYHYTIYKYDLGNRLLETIPPEGIDYIKPDSEDPEELQRVPRHMQEDAEGENKGMKSKYTSNSLYTLSYESPDEGRTDFYYDKAGRIRFSRDAIQIEKDEAGGNLEFNYTVYDDETGRISEVGVTSIPKGHVETKTEFEDVCDIPVFNDDGSPKLDSKGKQVMECWQKEITTYIPHGILGINGIYSELLTPEQLNDIKKIPFENNRIKDYYDVLEWTGGEGSEQREQTWYVYDQPQLELEGRKQEYIDGRLSKMYNVNGATYFSYDVHGRVLWATQEMTINNKQKHITVDYTYSKLTSRVEEIVYQRDVANETFAHRYLYDADNRLSKVLVSRNPNDNESWTQVAEYEYYLHGPLKNKKLLAKNGEGLDEYIQKVDYVYNINGWLKAINSPTSLANESTMAQDDANKGFAQDVFAEALYYYQGDYNRDLSNGDKVIQTPGGQVNLYSGNISGTITKSGFSQVGQTDVGDIMQQSYTYDVLNRFVAMSSVITNKTSTVQQGPSVTVEYDANGNIMNLNRTMVGGIMLDKMAYKYATHNSEDGEFKIHNRLLHVNDGIGKTEVATDMEDQGKFNLADPTSHNYSYDAMGRMVSNKHDDIELIEYNAYGKIKRMVPIDKSKPTVEYTYDAMQQRLSKKEIKPNKDYTETFYAYDAMGVPMAIYTHTHTASSDMVVLNDFMVYGSGRLGSYMLNEEIPDALSHKSPLSHESSRVTPGNLRFELTDRLGTVRAVITGEKTGEGNANIISLTDYYPYGMDIPGRNVFRRILPLRVPGL